MKKPLLAVLILVLLVVAAAMYLRATTPASTVGVRFPLTDSQRRLLESVPASAEAFALVPTAAAVHGKLVANPITRDSVEQWTEERHLPKPWMIGGADLVIWRSREQTSYAIHLDPIRALVIRAYLLFAPGGNAEVRAGTLLINGQDGQPLGQAALAPFLDLAAALPAGDAFAVQLLGGRGAFPPIGRPAVSSIKVDAGELSIVSRAASSEAPSRPGEAPAPRKLPQKALLSAWFAEPPRVLGDLDRLSLSRLSSLAGQGGRIILYDVNTGTLLPRPRGLIVVPSTPETKEAAERMKTLAEAVGEIREEDGNILFAFDRSSMVAYASETFADTPGAATEWAIRIDSQRMLPILRKLGDSTGLRLAASRVHRAARDLRRWIDVLEPAQTIDAALSRAGGFEELRVRITSK